MCYEKAQEIEPNDAQTKRNLSSLNYLLGKFEIAQDLIQQVFTEGKEKNIEDRIQLASCLAVLRKYKEVHYKIALARLLTLIFNMISSHFFLIIFLKELF